MREPFVEVAKLLVARGWRWDEEWAGVPVLMSPHSTIWLDPDPPWATPRDMLEVIARRLARIETAGPITDDVVAWQQVVADSRDLLLALQEVVD